MKIEINIGDKVKITKGKFAGKEAKVLFIDKKNNRYQLDGLKLQKIKTKKGAAKDLHGTFHFSSLQHVKPAAPQAEKPTPTETTAAPEQA